MSKKRDSRTIEMLKITIELNQRVGKMVLENPHSYKRNIEARTKTQMLSQKHFKKYVQFVCLMKEEFIIIEELILHMMYYESKHFKLERLGEKCDQLTGEEVLCMWKCSKQLGSEIPES